MSEVGEAELVDAFRQGRVLDCAVEGERRRLDASLLRRCCRSGSEVDPRGIRLRSAVIAGTLDLAGFELAFPLRFEDCVFESALLVEGARLAELALTGCPALPGLVGNGVRVDRDLNLSGSVVTGAHKTAASASNRSAIWLCESDIAGRLVCAETTIAGDGERSLQADRMHVGGSVRLQHNFTAVGEVRLIGAHVDGTLDLTGAHIDSPTELALDLGDAVINGSVFLISDATGRHPRLRGRIDMGGARVTGQILIRDVELEGGGVVPKDHAYAPASRAGTAVSPRLSVGGDVTLEGACRVIGDLDLSMSEMSGFSLGGDASVAAPGRTALDLTSARVRSSVVIEQGAVVTGTTRLTNATIGGYLSLRGAELASPEARASTGYDQVLVAAEGATVTGDVDLRDVSASGGRLDFRGARLGGVVNATRARLDNPGGDTLSLRAAVVNGSVRLNGIVSTGLLVLNRATVDGRLRCTGGSFTCPSPTESNEQGHGFQAVSATFRSGMDLDWQTVQPSADFTNATTSFLADNPGNWPPRFVISGFTYERYELPHGGQPQDTWDRAARCAWLSRQEPYDGGPYEHAAKVFRQHGYTREAEDILIAQRKAARTVARTGPLPGRIRQAIYGAAAGYGYRPGRVLWLLAVLLAAVTISLVIPAGKATMRASDSAGDVYSVKGLMPTGHAAQAVPARGQHPLRSPRLTARNLPAISAAPRVVTCSDGQVRCFNPFLYAVDTVIPLISLDQRSTWYPDTGVRGGSLMQWWLNIASLLGWLLSSIFVLSLARVVRNP